MSVLEKQRGAAQHRDQPETDPGMVSTLPWRSQTQAICSMVAKMATPVASRIGSCLRSIAVVVHRSGECGGLFRIAARQFEGNKKQNDRNRSKRIFFIMV